MAKLTISDAVRTCRAGDPMNRVWPAFLVVLLLVALPRGGSAQGDPTMGFVANFVQEVMRDSYPCLWRRLGSQGVEQFGRSEAFVSGLDYHLSFLDHVHEFHTS
jgi:hypothetical protein